MHILQSRHILLELQGFHSTRGFRFKLRLTWHIPKLDLVAYKQRHVFQVITCSLANARQLFWTGLFDSCPDLHHICGVYIWKTSRHTIGLLLISGPEIGSSHFPWLLLWIWWPFSPLSPLWPVHPWYVGTCIFRLCVKLKELWVGKPYQRGTGVEGVGSGGAVLRLHVVYVRMHHIAFLLE